MLRLKIDGSWEPKEFIEVLQAVENMYYKLVPSELPRLWLEEFYFGGAFSFDRYTDTSIPYPFVLDLTNQRLTERLRYTAPGALRLKVRAIQYASPGGIDLLGVGKVLEVICDSIGRMKVYWDDAHLRKERDKQASLDTKIKETKLEQEREILKDLKLKNAETAIRLLDSFPRAPEALLPLLVRDQDILWDLIAEGKLIDVELTGAERSSGR
ncbi:MAG: hypothetical protein INF75_15845 [Roseomonas sp.]|nr:hypothetical protein [Roseomonas sp.]MCA3325304.1 hypothetical protein [Roseomonas sp.]MCA3395773.1 hypothetical protein [Roseomonas sp.]MCA3401429.1 hypothetical protein [Roseomonas sp.]MCA3402208.1 hypothetical protein [Roseomonas sp.]